MRLAAFLSGLALLSAPIAVQAGDVAGTVYDSRGRPAAELRVAIPELGIETVTAADGSYRLSDVAAGEHELAVGLGALAVQRVSVSIDEQGEASRNIFLFSSTVVENAMANSWSAEDAATSAQFERTLELAERMTRESADREAQDWRWNDLEG